MSVSTHLKEAAEVIRELAELQSRPVEKTAAEAVLYLDMEELEALAHAKKTP